MTCIFYGPNSECSDSGGLNKFRVIYKKENWYIGYYRFDLDKKIVLKLYLIKLSNILQALIFS